MLSFLRLPHDLLKIFGPMFVRSELQDIVEIKASSVDRHAAVLDKLKSKYTNKLIEALGVSLFVDKIIAITEYEIQSEMLVANVIFEVVFYRFYQDEIVFGRIVKQEEEKIVIEDEMSNIYEVHAVDLFENCEFEGGEAESKWIWNYKGNQLPFITGERVRLRIKGLRFEDGIVEASMNDQGLGHVMWWD
ncbi:uncharacterized protein VICG_00126 [Vittaforma corneae ATCC 50505]|uniref:RNA polymerase III subunit Rpc25 domain-containing protein n=1 Tax=Vittaforma corneae (strain ATCC 50505) TaxID=993615 RepID=L2GPP6_VITCO|nr:uncharacterized protein VICG_00126 [Vittaforma corneae ATCC 50505]ELA42811.1 hypothetical protein VICG_00126 [Vittaforma corneae ATCC 50505]